MKCDISAFSSVSEHPDDAVGAAPVFISVLVFYHHPEFRKY